MNAHEIRAAAVKRLRGLGFDIADDSSLGLLASIIENNLGGKRAYQVSPGDYIRAFLAPTKPKMQVFPFKKLKPRQHLRQADIDAQPQIKSMGWDGSGTWWGNR